MDKVLTNWWEKLQKATATVWSRWCFYGSAAAGDHHAQVSDLISLAF